MEEKRSKRSLLALKKLMKAQEELQICQRKIKENMVGQAIALLKDIIIQQRQIDSHAFRGVGNAQTWRGEFAKGPSQWFMEALKNQQVDGNPFDLLNICYAIQLEAGKGNVEEMIGFYEQLKDSLGRREELQMGKGNLYYNSGQYLLAEKQYKKILRGRVSCPKVYLCLAWTNYQFGKKEQCLQFSQKYLQEDPQNKKALFLKIFSSTTKETFIREIERLVENNPSYFGLWVTLGKQSHDFEVKLKCYQKALELGCRESEIQVHIATANFEENKDLGMVRELLRKALAIENNAIAYRAMGKVEVTAKNYETAVRYYCDALKIEPFNFNTINRIGEIFYFNVKKMEKAIQYFTRYIQLNPYNAKVLTFIGLAFQENQSLVEARDYYLKALQVDPGHSSALGNLAGLAFDLGKYQKSLSLFSKANQASPQKVEYCEGIYGCYERLGCQEEASDWLRTCIHGRHSGVRAAFLKILANEQLKRRHYESAIGLLIQYEDERKSISIDLIMELINKIPRQEVSPKHLMKKVADRVPVREDHIYSFVLLTQIFQELKMEVERLVWLERASNMNKSRRVELISEFLGRKRQVALKEVKKEEQ